MNDSSVGAAAVDRAEVVDAQGPWRTTLVASFGLLAAYVPVTAVITALPSIQRGLSASASSLQWVSDALVIPMAALILSAGVFGDVHGRRKVFLAGLMATAVGSIVSMSALRVEVLWLGDAVMGIGAAAVVPSSLALISHAVTDHHERSRHIAVWATALSVGMGVGALAAGALLQAGSWRWAFLPGLVAAALSLLVGAWGAADSRSPVPRHLDWPGQILGTAAVCGLVYGVIEGAGSGWSGPRSILGFVVAVGGAVLFVVAESRSTSPMLDLAVFRARTFTGASVVAIIAMFGLIGLFYVSSLFYGGVQHLDGLQIAYRLATYCGVLAIASLAVGRIMHRFRPQLLMAFGLLVIAAGMAWMVTVDAQSGFLAAAARMIVIAGGFAFVFTPMTAVSSVDHHLTGMASAGINAVRQVGGALGPAVFGAILIARQTAHLPGALADHGVATADRSTIIAHVDAHGINAAAAATVGPATQGFADSLTYAMHVCVLVGAGAMVAAAVVALALQPRTPR